MAKGSKRKLQDAAKDVFARLGYQSTHVSDIVSEAGVARGTFYLHYESKKELFEAVVRDAIATLRNSIDGVDVSLEAQTMESQLQDSIQRILDTAVHNRAAAIILVREAPNAGMLNHVQAFYDSLLMYLEISIRNGQQLGWLRTIPPTSAALCVLGAVKQILERLLKSDDNDEKAIHEMTIAGKALVDFTLHGIASAL